MRKNDHICEKHKGYTEKDIIQDVRASLKKEGRFEKAEETNQMFDSLSDEKKLDYLEIRNSVLEFTNPIIKDIYHSIGILSNKGCETIYISLSGTTAKGKKFKTKDPIVVMLG